MSWKIFILQTAVLVLLAWLSGQYFAGQQGGGMKDVQDQLAAETARLHQRLDELERQAREIGGRPPAAAAVQAAPPENGDALAALARRIETLEAREQDVRQTTDALLKEKALLAQTRRQAQPEHVRLQDWMSSLEAEKKAEVEAAYKAELDLMQKTFPAAPDAPPPSPEDMLRLLEESRERLKLRLKDILDGEEYQAFLESLDDQEALPAGLPLLERRQ
jgi:chromosome segregation ATPase